MWDRKALQSECRELQYKALCKYSLGSLWLTATIHRSTKSSVNCSELLPRRLSSHKLNTSAATRCFQVQSNAHPWNGAIAIESEVNCNRNIVSWRRLRDCDSPVAAGLLLCHKTFSVHVSPNRCCCCREIDSLVVVWPLRTTVYGNLLR